MSPDLLIAAALTALVALWITLNQSYRHAIRGMWRTVTRPDRSRHEGRGRGQRVISSAPASGPPMRSLPPAAIQSGVFTVTPSTHFDSIRTAAMLTWDAVCGCRAVSGVAAWKEGDAAVMCDAAMQCHRERCTRIPDAENRRWAQTFSCACGIRGFVCEGEEAACRPAIDAMIAVHQQTCPR